MRTEHSSQHVMVTRITSPRLAPMQTVIAAALGCSLGVPTAMAQSTGGVAAHGDWLMRLFASHAGWLWFLGAFLGGLSLNLTPCVYPMIPVTVAFFSGQAAGRLGSAVRLGLLYVVGMSLTYAILGLLAAKTGALMGSWLQHPWVLIGMAGVVLILAASMFGVYELRPPGWVTQRLGQAKAGSTGALVMGLTVGLVAAPCIGPFVLGLLTLVSQLANPWLGFLLFLTMGLGMGLPYVVLGVFANRLSRWPKAGSWLVWVKQCLGVALIGLALYFIRPLVAPLLFRWLVVGVLFAAGVYLGWLERSRFHGWMVWCRRLVGLACVGAALAFVPLPDGQAVPTIVWQPYRPALLEQAKREHRPVLIDIYADWCIPCVELDHVTFRHPDVVERMSHVLALRVDATQDVPPEAEELLERYEVYGVPTILLFDGRGQERSDLRVNGFVPPDEMLKRLAQLTRAS